MKNALILVGLIVTAKMAFAQGVVQFNNSTATGPVMQWTSTSDSTLIPVPKSVGTTTINGRVEVLAFYNSTSASLTPLFTQTTGGVKTTFTTLGDFLSQNSGWATYGTVGISTLQNGAFNDGVQTVGVNDGVGGATPDGANASYAILGWTGNYATYDLADAANVATPGSSFMGISSIFTTASGGPMASPPGAAISISGGFTGMGAAGSRAGDRSGTHQLRAGRSGRCRSDGFPSAQIIGVARLGRSLHRLGLFVGSAAGAVLKLALVIPLQRRTVGGDVGPFGVLGRRFRPEAPRAPSPVVNTIQQKEKRL